MKKFKDMMKKRRGVTAVELVAGLVVLGILGGVGVAIGLTMRGNADEQVAQQTGVGVYNAVTSFVGDYGALPADAAALDAYLVANEDVSITGQLPAGVSINVWDDPASGALEGIIVEITSTEFDDHIIIDRTGQTDKFPSASAPTYTGTALMTW